MYSWNWKGEKRMLKTLIKKQLQEIGAFLYYDAKKGVRRSNGKKIGYWLVLLMLFGYLAAMFYFVADWLGAPMTQVGLDWFFMALMSLMAVALGVFGSVFNTYSSVYLAKDNEALLSMPIKPNLLLVARLIAVYIMGLVYMAIVYIPAMIIEMQNTGFSVSVFLGMLAVMFALSLVVLVLSALLGWVVAMLSVHLKGKSFITVFISLVFIAAYYYFYVKVAGSLSELIKNLLFVGQKVEENGYLIYQLGMAAMGDAKGIAIWLSISIAAMFVTYFLLARSFTKIMTMKKGEKKQAYQASQIVVRSVERAVFKKEMQRFTSSAGYMLNCGLGSVFMIAAGVGILMKSSSVTQAFALMGVEEGTLALMVTAATCLMATMNDITAPCISMEGKHLWILQTLPVSTWQVLKAKLKVHLVVTLPPVWFCAGCMGWAFKLDTIGFIWMMALSTLFVFFSAMNGLVIGLKFPNLHWTNETAALKQSFGVLFALFGNWVFILLIGGLYIWIGDKIAVDVFKCGLAVLLVALCYLMLVWLKKRGTKIYQYL